MNEKTIDRLINILYTLCAIAVLLGAFFKLQHYPHGSQLLWSGFVVGTLVSFIDNLRLRKMIKELELRKFTK